MTSRLWLRIKSARRFMTELLFEGFARSTRSRVAREVRLIAAVRWDPFALGLGHLRSRRLVWSVASPFVQRGAAASCLVVRLTAPRRPGIEEIQSWSSTAGPQDHAATPRRTGSRHRSRSALNRPGARPLGAP